MKKQLNYADIIKEALILTGAVAIIAAAVYFFLVPSHTSVSSISGLGIVLSNFVPLPLSAITMILNVVLLIIGFFTCGREFGVKTVYTSIVLPLYPKLRGQFAEFLNNPSPVGLRIFFLPTCVGLRYGHRRNSHSFSRHLPSRTSVLTSLDRYRNQHPAPRLHMCPCV